MATKLKLDFKGFENMLENIERAGGNAEAAVTRALQESADLVYKDLKPWAVENSKKGRKIVRPSKRDTNKRYRYTQSGSILDALVTPVVEKDGNIFSVKVGFSFEKNKGGALHSIFKEYGTPYQPASPGIRPALEKNKNKAKKLQKDILNQILKEAQGG